MTGGKLGSRPSSPAGLIFPALECAETGAWNPLIPVSFPPFVVASQFANLLSQVRTRTSRLALK